MTRTAQDCLQAQCGPLKHCLIAKAGISDRSTTLSEIIVVVASSGTNKLRQNDNVLFTVPAMRRLSHASVQVMVILFSYAKYGTSVKCAKMWFALSFCAASLFSPDSYSHPIIVYDGDTIPNTRPHPTAFLTWRRYGDLSVSNDSKSETVILFV